MEAVLGKIQTLVKGQLGGLRSKVKSQGQKKVDKLKEKIPTQDQLMEKMKNKACDPNNKKRLEAKYNKLKNNLKKLQNIALKAAALVAGLAAALAALNALITILDVIITILNVIIKILNIVVKIVKIVVKFLGGTGTGGAIDVISRLIAKAEYNIKKWKNAIGRAKEFIKKMLKKYIRPLTKILAKIAAALAALAGLIAGAIAILEMIYMLIISQCAINQENSLSSDDQNTNSNLNDESAQGNKLGQGTGINNKYAGIAAMLEEKTPEEILGTLANSGNTEFIEYTQNANFETIGYKRFYEALDTSNDLSSQVGKDDFTFGIDDDEFNSLVRHYGEMRGPNLEDYHPDKR
tara:strand:+ start:373 stop:1422 length:1050 start_codon:yes stop_codon:yes gene_type:complete